MSISPLENMIRERVAERGGITVAEYMELALAHPEHGYYMTRDPFGEQGDFTTAPEVCQIFGELIGAWLAAMWQMLGQQEMVLVELGPGRGTLMTDALRATRHVQGFHESLVIVLVETSLQLRRFQRATLGGLHPRISWQPTLEGVPDMPMLFVANEFFDALPVRQYVKTSAGLQERMVVVDEDTGDLAFEVRPMGVQLVKGGSHREEANTDGLITESCPAGRQIADTLAQHLAQYGGAGLVIDYGYTGESRGNTLQAVRQHGFWPVLQAPGEADITAHVAFDELASCFEEQGVGTAPVKGQGEFLHTIGGGLRLETLLREGSREQGEALSSGYERLVSPQAMGELFKVLTVCSDANISMPGV